jgi:ribosomal protein S18 acetylase RimI-like enzyme
MLDNLHYRKGSPSDLEQLKQLGIASYGRFKPELSPLNWEKMQAALSDDATYRYLLQTAAPFICTSAAKAVGMAFLMCSGNPTDIYAADCCYIRFVGVDPAFEGRGIAKTLTRSCIDYAKSSGEKIIMLHTSEMMDAARHIYESFGFIRQREIEPRYGKRYWLYKLELVQDNKP